MAELKTQKNDDSVDAFIAGIDDEGKREDSRTLVDMVSKVTGEEPKMWGSNIVGFGDFHYRYKTGREGDTFRVGFSPRKQNLTIYVMDYVPPGDPLLASLGKHTRGKACIYIKHLDDVDLEVLGKLVLRSYEGSG